MQDSGNLGEEKEEKGTGGIGRQFRGCTEIKRSIRELDEVRVTTRRREDCCLRRGLVWG